MASLPASLVKGHGSCIAWLRGLRLPRLFMNDICEQFFVGPAALAAWKGTGSAARKLGKTVTFGG